LDGPLPKWCPAVALSRQDGRHSAISLLLKAALIQVSDYRLLGASGLFRKFHQKGCSFYAHHTSFYYICHGNSSKLSMVA
jgi:hypothetical protein